MQFFSHLKLCLATAIHNFKWLKITCIYEIKVTIYISVLSFEHILFERSDYIITDKNIKSTEADISALGVKYD